MLPGPIGWLLTMADAGIPDKLLPAIRIGVFWAALPFIGLLLGSEEFRSGGYGWAAGWYGCATLSILIAVYWDRILPWRLRASQSSLKYLAQQDSDLGDAIKRMVRRSAWGRWYAAQHLVNAGSPIRDLSLLQIAGHVVMDEIVNGRPEIRGRRPGQLDYEAIPRTHWRSSTFYFLNDPISLWKMIICPVGGVEIAPDGTIARATHEPSAARTAQLAGFDSLIVDGDQFERLWPDKSQPADKKRKQFLRQAKWRGLDKDEIKKLS
jgi:hypothetical protein